MPELGVDDSMSKLRSRILEINRETAKFYHGVLKSPSGKVGLDYFLQRGLKPSTSFAEIDSKCFGITFSTTASPPVAAIATM